jgi:hypothetical protein
VAGLEIPDSDSILTPGCSTLGVKRFAILCEPAGFADGLGDVALLIWKDCLDPILLSEFGSRVYLAFRWHAL